MKTQDVCKQTGIAKRNIHFYIKEKLISPAVSPANGYYDFNEKDCQKLCLIRELRNAGLSLAVIRSLLERPATAGYYLNLYVKQLNRQKQLLEQTVAGMNYILEHLPIHPRFSTLHSLTMEAGFPISAAVNGSDSFDIHDNMLVNRFLWSSFLPDKELTEYQEFLWAKLNRLTNTTPGDDYRKLHDFLQTLKQNAIAQMFASRSQHYEFVAALDPDSCADYAVSLQNSLRVILDNKTCVSLWQKHYQLFFAPSTRIFDSGINEIIAEMSPLFVSYLKNIHAACAILYHRLHTAEGLPLLRNLRNTFREQLDLEDCHHGQLEAIACLTETPFPFT